MAYLYGSSIQGIQSFIFETNKLREIVGASEIVDNLSGNFFKEKFKLNSPDFIMHAAGNIKLVLEDRDLLAEIVRAWPKIVQEKAPGLTLSQAVVTLDGDLTQDHIMRLEEKLKTQRNKGGGLRPLAAMAMVRSRRTGHPAVDWKDEQSAPRDLAVRAKQEVGKGEALHSLMEKSFPSDITKSIKSLPMDVSDITGKGETGWLAVIHADGNGLGKVIQSMAGQMAGQPSEMRRVFKEFSGALDQATINAARASVKEIILPEVKGEGDDSEHTVKLPFRPVLLGGDDLTVIIRADLALDFTRSFLNHFENETAERMAELSKQYGLAILEKGLTSCAGIAFMKESYPFHYAADLAEELSAYAKKVSREVKAGRMPSSLAFHKIQDSFVDSYEDITERELTAGDISFRYGPYFINNEYLPSVETLENQVNAILKKEAPLSGLRNWLALLYDDPTRAELWLDRVCKITREKAPKEDFVGKLGLMEAVKDNKTHLYDVLSMASLMRGAITGGENHG